MRQFSRHGKRSSGVETGPFAGYPDEDLELVTYRRGTNNEYVEFFRPNGTIGEHAVAHESDVVSLEVWR